MGSKRILAHEGRTIDAEEPNPTLLAKLARDRQRNLDGLFRQKRVARMMKRFVPAPVVRSGIALMASTGVSSGLGLVFWVVAAHLAKPTAVGRASADVSAMSLFALLSQLNLVNIYTRFLPRSGARARRFVIGGYAICVTFALVSSSLLVVAGGARSVLHLSGIEGVAFIGAVGLWTIFVLQDSVLTGLRAAKWVPLENGFFATGKILLLVFLASFGASGIFLSWVIPVVPAVALVSLYLFARRIPDHHVEAAGRSEFPTRRTLRNFVIAEYASSFVGAIGGYLPPVVIVGVLGARAGAYFYLPWLVGTVADALLWNVSTSFVVEAGYARENPRSLLRRSGQLAVSVMLPLLLVLFLGAPLILNILGPKYSSGGTMLLRLVLLSIIPMSVTTLYQMFAWYDGKLWKLVGVQGLRVATFFAITVSLLNPLRTNAAGVGMLSAYGIFALVLIRPVVKRWRTLSSPPSIGGAAGVVTSSP